MPSEFQLFAEPWWVNLLILAPVIASLSWWRTKLDLPAGKLALTTLFAIAFGFVEAAVVVYVRAATELRTISASTVGGIPPSLYVIELLREAATLVVLLAVAFLGAPRSRERWALFLWSFAIWDICYYVGLYLTIGWPASLTTRDILFLIPVPWLAQVWFPLFVSILTIAAVFTSRRAS